MNLGLVYAEGTDVGQLSGYVDADWAGDATDRKSYSGIVFMCAGSAVFWQSRKQDITALSSTEAEYIALSEGTKPAIFFKSLLTHIAK